MKNLFFIGDALEVLGTLPSKCIQMCVTSPPYFGLRIYTKSTSEIGREESIQEYVDKLVAIFTEVHRVMKDDGTLWLNLGDSYNAAGRIGHGTRQGFKQGTNRASATKTDLCRPTAINLKPKDLLGIPWRVAFALQDKGWTLRSDIIWYKPNPMPESVKDRPTKSHEYIFMFSKQERYYYDHKSIAEPFVGQNNHDRTGGQHKPPGQSPHSRKGAERGTFQAEGRNARSVWTMTPKPYNGAHFAVFPPELPNRCIHAGSRLGDVVLDPFAGSGTTLAEAKRLGRPFIGIDLDRKCRRLVNDRVMGVKLA